MIDAVDGIDRLRYTSPSKDMREDVIEAREPALAVRAHPAASVGIQFDPEEDASHLHARAVHGPRRDDPGAGSGLRDHHRHHRRVPR